MSTQFCPPLTLSAPYQRFALSPILLQKVLKPWKLE